MSKKTIIIIVVIAVIVLGAWWYSSQQSVPSIQTQSLNSQPVNQTPLATTSGNLSTSSTNSSDAALAQDLGSVDAQMSGLSTDNASADKGLSNPNQ